MTAFNNLRLTRNLIRKILNQLFVALRRLRGKKFFSDIAGTFDYIFRTPNMFLLLQLLSLTSLLQFAQTLFGLDAWPVFL